MILTLTGVIALAGIVVNNNIVLIDTFQQDLTIRFGQVSYTIIGLYFSGMLQDGFWRTLDKC